MSFEEEPPASPRSSTSSSSGSFSPLSTVPVNNEERTCLVMYEALMENEKAREVFSEFLREEALNEEPMLFLQDLTSYEAAYDETRQLIINSKSQSKAADAIKKLRTKARNIVERYIEESSVKELNLGSQQSDILKLWALVEKMMLDSDQACTKLFESLNPTTLFGTVAMVVNIDLKYDQFPRFVRSKRMTNFLATAGESLTKQLGIKTETYMEVDSIRYKQQDFNSKIICDRDIYLSIHWCEDTPDWKLVSDKNQVRCYTSEFTYTEGVEDMTLTKVIFHLPYPVEDVWNVFCDQSSRKFFDNYTYNWKLENFTSPTASTKDSPEIQREELYSIQSPPLATQQIYHYVDLKLLLVKDRFLPLTMTSIYDPKIKCYMNVGHTAHTLDEKSKPCQLKELDMVFCYFFFKVNDHDTRVMNIVCTDINVPIAQTQLFMKVIKTRAGIIKQGFETCLKKGKMQKVDDFLQYNKAVKENASTYPNRSWFTEYHEKKQLFE